MKWILALLLFVSAAASAQIGLRDDSTKYIHYKYQYGSRMPRFWADSALHIPYYDTSIVKPQKPGAIMMHTDKIVYKWNGGGWEQMSGGVAGLTNVGTGYNLVATPSGNVKKLNNGYGILIDSATSNTNTVAADTSSTNHLVTQSDLNDAVAGAGGVTTMAPIGSSPNANGASISGNTLTLQPASASFGGVTTTIAQTFAGNKTWTGRRSNFYGYAPRLNSQWMPSTKIPDSIYIANQYLGFGFIDMFASGTYVMVYTSADNHVCDNGVIVLAKSKDQGRTWTSDTIVTGGGGYDVTMGGGGVSPSNRLIIFFQRLENVGQNGIDLRTMYSDDEGETWSSEQTHSTESQTYFQMYGGLVKIGGDSLLLSWYGIDTTTAPDTYNSYIIKSGDDGVTWSNPITVISSTASQYTESSFAYLGGNVLIGLIRREQSDSTFAQVISYNNGNTWAYQGKVSFGIHGTPAWLKTFQGNNGKKEVVCYYRSGTLGNYDLRAIYGHADSVILGPDKWIASTEVTLATGLEGSGYVTVVHPYDQPFALLRYYDETDPQTAATMKFITLPIGENLPIGAASGISGLTADRVSIAASASSLKDFNTLKYQSSTNSLLINNVTPLAWSGHNGGVIEGGRSSLVLSQDNFAAVLQNSYLDTDYKGVGTGGASALIQDAGNFYLFNTSSTSAGATITWNSRLRIDPTGAWHLGGATGSLDQVLSSNGAGTPPTWKTFTSSQWMDVVSPAGIKYTGGNVGIGGDGLAPLHVIANTTGVGNYAARVSDNNSSIGAEFVLDWRGGAVNEKVKSIVVDGVGMNFNKRTDAFGAPAVQMTIKHNGTINIPSLDTDGSAPTTSGTTKMLVSDANGDISFKDEPSGGVSGLTSGRVTLSTGSTTVGDDADLLFNGTSLSVSTTNTQGQLNIGGNKNLSSSGAQQYNAAATYTDNVTAASGTASSFSINLFAAPTIAATNSNVTFPSITNLFVDAPAAGTNATITNKYAIQTGTNGHMRVQGKLYLTDRDSSATPANVAWIDPLTEQVKVGPYQRTLKNSTTWDPASIGANSSTTTTLTVTGAALGDPVTISKTSGSYSNGEIYFAYVSATDTVTIQLQNGSGGTFDIASATFNVVVLKY